MRLYRWIPDTKENLGDWLNVPILRALGHEPEPPSPDDPVLFAVGSILGPVHYELCGSKRVVVWGSGGSPHIPPGVQLDFRAVRGPATRAMHCLSDDVPTGDPALLLPRLVTLPKPEASGEVLYVNHINHPAGELPGAVPLTAHVEASECLSLVARIAAARFVASESLHGAIVAAAYGVPWSPCSIRWGENELAWHCKWNDWLGYLGVLPLRKWPGTLAEARGWWERHGRHGRLRDTKPLLDAFPHDPNTQGRFIRAAEDDRSPATDLRQ